ncbi:DUF4215 domain-containing protein [Patescibacteria group bacterium]|nr:DUF4215 domain-containing protein [Patescibacteria group bacterium]
MYGSETCTADCTLRPTTAKVVAQKIVCNDEADLPNWGSEGAAPITSTTAQEFVDASDENCWFAEGRSFQWGNDDVTNPGDEYYGAAENGWNTFGTTDDDGMTMTEIPVGDNEHFWIREVLQDGYIPFTYEASEGNSNDVSAEIYCATDAINYDNFDRIDAPVAGETYYCVAFNVAEEEVPACGNGEIDRMNYLTKTVQIDDIQIPVGEECDDGNTVDGDGCSSECTIEYICEFEESNGWYGQYYNYPSTHPDMNLSPEVWPDAGHGDPEAGLGWDTDWYDNTYFKFAKVDANLEFGTNFFPFDGAWSEELSSNNHEHHFGVHWSAQTYIANTGTYNFTMTTDDDIWVYVDGVLVDQTAGIHPATANAFSVALNPGTHIFDIYYADRHITKTHMYFTSLDQLTFVPYNENCNEVDPICGNEVVESGETCDDGNDIAGDGCENNCTVSVCNPQQNLVYNGGFEEPALDANTWSIIPNVAGGWTVEAAGTDTPDGLEIQNSLWTPYEGVQYAELDGNLSTEIGQTLTTIPGQNYSLNFALSARPGVVISSNGIEVYWNGVLVAPVIVLDGSANSDTAWSTYSYNVLAVGTSSTLLIKDAGISDTLGMFVDNVSVMCPMVQD